MNFRKIFRPVFVFLLFSSIVLNAQGRFELPRSTPEKEGVSSKGIQNFLDAVEKSRHEFHSFMFLRHGKVIAEGWWKPYGPELKQTMYSVSKSFTSTAVGFAAAEKKLSLDDKVISFFPDQLPDTVSPNLADMKVRDLLTMTAGQDPDPTFLRTRENDWVKAFLSVPVLNKPGTKFLYNSMATFMLSAIVQKVTGEKLIDYLKPRLFEPLGISGIDWEESPMGINSGGWGLRLKTEDMARFGQLYLQKGKWNGRQVLPAEWVEEATTKKIDQNPLARQGQKDSSDWLQGYCYKFWRCRNNAFRADGAYGQFIIIMPDQDAVIVFTSESSDLQGEVNLVWQHLLPAIGSSGLSADISDAGLLKARLAGLSLKVSSGPLNNESPFYGRTIVFEPNVRNIKSISFDVHDRICSMHMATDNNSFRLAFGCEDWAVGETMKPGPSLFRGIKGGNEFLFPLRVAGRINSSDAAALELKLRYIESPHTETMLFHIDSKKVSLDIVNSNDQSKIHLQGELQQN